MLTADEIRRRIEWLIPKGDVSDTLSYITPPWPEEHGARWSEFEREGLTVFPSGRRFIERLTRELAAVGATLEETTRGEYPEYSPATELRVWPAYETATQACYVLSKVVDMAFGVAMPRRADGGVDTVRIASAFPDFQKEHEIALRVMSEFGVEYIDHDHELLFEKCDGYTIYCEREGVGLLEPACIGEILFFDSLYDPKAPVRF